jgi:hypothetical protein
MYVCLLCRSGSWWFSRQKSEDLKLDSPFLEVLYFKCLKLPILLDTETTKESSSLTLDSFFSDRKQCEECHSR